MTRRLHNSAKKSTSLDRNFTILEAQSLLTSAGGTLTVRDVVIELLWTTALAGSLAYAIQVGHATLWHLLLPMVAEYLALLAVFPVAALVVRHPEIDKLRKESWRGGLFFLLLISGVVAWRVSTSQNSILTQIAQDGRVARDWILDHHLLWPMVIAALHSVRNTIHSLRHLVRHGPPFWGPGLGCGMRIAVLFLAIIVLPVITLVCGGALQDLGISWTQGPSFWALASTWLLWGLLVLADVLTLAMRWDLQRRLRQKGFAATLENT